MRTMVKFLLCNLIAFGFVSGAYGLTIPASEDTVGSTVGGQSKLTAAANAAPNLMVDATHTAFLYFNLNEVPQDAVLRWAKLRLFLPSVRVKGAGLGVHVVTSQWDEALASNQPTVATGTVASIGPEKLGTRRFVTVDVTNTVQSWISGGTVNEGFAIKPISGGTAVSSLYLTSKDGASLGLPAELDLDFKPAVEAPASVSVEQLPSSVRALLTPTVDELPAALKTLLAPKITTQAGILSDSLSMGAVVEGLGPFNYQWYKNGMAVTGGTGSKLSLIGLTSGTYLLKASNGVSTVTSSSVEFVPLSPSIALAPIPSGAYTIGNVSGDSDLTDNPVRSVTLSPYSIAVNDTSKDKWRTIRTWALSHGYTDLALGEGKMSNHPVETVTWYDVVKWANAASEKDCLTPCYTVSGAVYRMGEEDAVTCDWSASGYRLPTEAEWEVAARGGLTGKRFPLGDTISQSQANYYAYSNFGFSYELSRNGFNPTYATGGEPYTSPVGSFDPNGYGLYQMAGNVFQWCWDFYGDTVGGSDPKGVGTGSSRVLRGGGWSSTANYSRSANRVKDTPTAAFNYYGFRLVRGAGAPVAGRQSMVGVLGGTLPSESGLAGQVVQNFAIGGTEVTWGDWKTVRDWAVSNGYIDLANLGTGSGDNYPVTNVSWYDAVKWCNARSEKEGKAPVYQVNGATYKTGQSIPTLNTIASGYRLPTEAEWEWAARGGRQTHGFAYSGSDDLNVVGWYADNSGAATHAVGTKAANELGISDMSGNVWEWCWDLSGDFDRRIRGGSCYNNIGNNTVAFHGDYNNPVNSYGSGGFRLACNCDIVSVLGGTLPSESALAGHSVGDFQIGKTEVTWDAWKAVRDWAVNNGDSYLAGLVRATGTTVR